MNERLTPRERIRKKKEFLFLYNRGRRYRGRYFNLVYLVNRLEYSRMAVVVSRKIGGAVVRNRVKRRMRDLFRRNKTLLQAPLDIVVIARKEIIMPKRGELAEDFLSALQAISGRPSSP